MRGPHVGDLSIFPKNIKKIMDLKIAASNRGRVKSGWRKTMGESGMTVACFDGFRIPVLIRYSIFPLVSIWAISDKIIQSTSLRMDQPGNYPF